MRCPVLVSLTEAGGALLLSGREEASGSPSLPWEVLLGDRGGRGLWLSCCFSSKWGGRRPLAPLVFRGCLEEASGSLTFQGSAGLPGFCLRLGGVHLSQSLAWCHGHASLHPCQVPAATRLAPPSSVRPTHSLRGGWSSCPPLFQVRCFIPALAGETRH